jgi:hypothetical protein
VKAHRTDLVSFAFGLVFLALSAWWLLAQLLGLALPPVGWFLASALILIGVFGLVGALRSGRPSQPDPTTEAIAPVSGTSVSAAPVSGASAPVSGAATSTSGAALPVWEAELSTWDNPSSAPAREAPTTEFRTEDTPATDVIHPAWLAHPPSESPTEPIAGRPGDGGEEPTAGILDRPTPSEGDEPTRSDQPGEAAGDQVGRTSDGQPGEAAGDQPGDEREGRRRDV